MARPKHIYEQPSREDLELVVRSSSISEAAVHFCGKKSAHYIIRKWCEDYGIPVPRIRKRRTSWNMPHPTGAQLENLLHTKATLKEVGEELDLTPSQVLGLIKYFKLKR